MDASKIAQMTDGQALRNLMANARRLDREDIYGRVTSTAVMSKDFVLPDGKKLSEVELSQPNVLHDLNDPENTDYIVGVKWHKAFPISDAQTFRGAFSNQNIVCKLRDPATLEFLKGVFEVGAENEPVSDGEANAG